MAASSASSASVSAAGAPALAATYVYVSNAEDGDISSYTLQVDGTLAAGARTTVAGMVMPMAVSPDKRLLYAASRAKPFSVYTFTINPGNGALRFLASSPLAESFPYISLDKSGRYLLGASYAGHLVSVNAIGADGRVAAGALQVVPVGRNAHSIRVDGSNKFLYVPCLGSDQIFQFSFDVATGRLASSTPAVAQMPAMSGPRHFVTSSDNKFLYALSELKATVTTFAINPETGALAELTTVAGLPAGSTLGPGAPRGGAGLPGAPVRNTDNDIWAADIHITPDDKFLYISERTSSSVGAFSVDAASGKLTFLGSTPTEKQPRSFAISANGRFMVVSGEKSATLSAYAIDEASGALKLSGKAPAGKGANWVEIVSFDQAPA